MFPKISLLNRFVILGVALTVALSLRAHCQSAPPVATPLPKVSVSLMTRDNQAITLVPSPETVTQTSSYGATYYNVRLPGKRAATRITDRYPRIKITSSQSLKDRCYLIGVSTLSTLKDRFFPLHGPWDWSKAPFESHEPVGEAEKRSCYYHDLSNNTLVLAPMGYLLAGEYAIYIPSAHVSQATPGLIFDFAIDPPRDLGKISWQPKSAPTEKEVKGIIENRLNYLEGYRVTQISIESIEQLPSLNYQVTLSFAAVPVHDGAPHTFEHVTTNIDWESWDAAWDEEGSPDQSMLIRTILNYYEPAKLRGTGGKNRK